MPLNDPIYLQPGDLRHSIQIQQPQYTAGGRGKSVTPASWTTVLTVRAAIYTAGGRETSQAAQIVSQVSHVVKIRWQNTAIAANYQVLFGDRIFTIQYVENVQERNRVLNLYCLEVNQGGGQL